MVYPSLFRIETIAIWGTSIPGIPMVRQTAPVVPSTAGRTSTFCAIHLGEGRQSASHCQSPREPSAWNDRDHWHFDQCNAAASDPEDQRLLQYLCHPMPAAVLSADQIWVSENRRQKQNLLLVPKTSGVQDHSATDTSYGRLNHPSGILQHHCPKENVPCLLASQKVAQGGSFVTRSQWVEANISGKTWCT